MEAKYINKKKQHWIIIHRESVLINFYVHIAAAAKNYIHIWKNSPNVDQTVNEHMVS